MAEYSPALRWMDRWLLDPLEGATVYVLFALLKALSIDAASAFGGWVARAIGPRLGVSKRARQNLARAFPEKSPAEIGALVREVWDNLGRTAAEYPHLAGLRIYPRDGREPDGRVEVRGAEHVDRALATGKPLIFFAAHQANWEMSAMAALQYGVPLNLVYRPANNPWVDRQFHAPRRDRSASLIPKGADGARQTVTLLRQGRHLGMLLDQKMNDGIPVPFFGRPAMTAAAPAQLALKFDCPLLPIQVERLGGVRFRVTVHPPLDIARSGDRHADILAIMTRINALFEDWIRQRPGQWLWLHNRWPD